MANSGTVAGADFGSELRQERQGRGVSLERLSAITKVGIAHLQALERGAFNDLPGGVFRRGIVRAYLQAVGLDEPQWMQRFKLSYEAQMRALGTSGEAADESWQEFARNVRRSRSGEQRALDTRWLGVIALFLVLALAAWVVWHFLLRSRLRP